MDVEEAVGRMTADDMSEMATALAQNHDPQALAVAINDGLSENECAEFVGKIARLCPLDVLDNAGIKIDD